MQTGMVINSRLEKLHFIGQMFINSDQLKIHPLLPHFASLRTVLKRFFYQYLSLQSYIQIDSPSFGPLEREGNQQIPLKDRFYLTPTKMIYLQQANKYFPKTFSISPCFRPDSDSFRHRQQFWMLDLQFRGDFQQLLKVCEDLFRSLLKELVEKHYGLMKLLQDNGRHSLKYLQQLSNTPIKRITYHQAVQLLVQLGDPVSQLQNLNQSQQLKISQKLGPVFVTHYPLSIRGLHQKLFEGTDLTQSFDFLLPGVGQTAGGSQSEQRLEVIYERIREREIKSEGLQRRHKRLRGEGRITSGMGLGFDRLVMFLGRCQSIGQLQFS